MRRSTALCMVACLAFSTPIHAQEAPAVRRTPVASSTMAPRARAALLLELQSAAAPRPASSLVASAARAASHLELQPTAPARSGRHKGRLYGGLAMLGLSPLLIFSAFFSGAGESAAVANVLFFGGIGLGVGGGVMIALADSSSPISVRDRRPDEPASFALRYAGPW